MAGIAKGSLVMNLEIENEMEMRVLDEALKNLRLYYRDYATRKDINACYRGLDHLQSKVNDLKIERNKRIQSIINANKESE